MRLQRNLKLIDAYTVCMNMLFLLPVVMLYYQDEIGLGFREFLIGEAAFAATIVLLDVPTGWISDVWQRKRALALGILFNILGFACLLVAKSFFMAVLAQALLGVGISLCNGTNTAILYDSLLSARREGEYRRREGRRQGLCFYITAVTSVMGGFLYALDHHLPLALMLVTMTAALIAACLLDEPERHRKARERHPVADIVATTKYALHGHAEVAFLILSAAALFSSTKLIMWSQQPYYMALRVPESWYGALMAVGFILGGAASHGSHLLDGRISPRRSLILIWIFAVLICLGAGISPGWHGIALLMMGGTCIYGLASPRINAEINHLVSSDRRATILSTQTLLSSLLFIPLSTAMGHISKHWGIQAVLLAIALWLCVAGTGLSVRAARRKRRL